MKHEFFKKRLISTVTFVFFLLIILAIAAYLIVYDYINTITLSLILLICVALMLSIYSYTLVLVDVEARTLGKYIQTPFGLHQNGYQINTGSILYIFVNRTRYSKTTRSWFTFASVTGEGYEYMSYLKLNDDENLPLEATGDRELALEQAEQLAEILQVRVHDNTLS